MRARAPAGVQPAAPRRRGRPQRSAISRGGALAVKAVPATGRLAHLMRHTRYNHAVRHGSQATITHTRTRGSRDTRQATCTRTSALPCGSARDRFMRRHYACHLFSQAKTLVLVALATLYVYCTVLHSRHTADTANSAHTASPPPRPLPAHTVRSPKTHV